MEQNYLELLGNLIKLKRRQLDISQEELAWRCNMTKNGLGKIELGRSQVRITTLMTIMHETGITFIDLHNLQTK